MASTFPDSLISDLTLVADGYLRVNDVIRVHPCSSGQGEVGHDELYGDCFKLVAWNGLLALVQEDSTGKFTTEPLSPYWCFSTSFFYQALKEQMDAHDGDEGYEGDEPESNAENFPVLLDDFGIFKNYLYLRRPDKAELFVGDWTPSEDYADATSIINRLALEASKAKPVVAKAEPVKAEKPKRAKPLGFTLADLVEPFKGEGVKNIFGGGMEDCFSVDFYILKKEGIKESMVLEEDEGEWVLTARDGAETFTTLKEAFVWLNTVVRAEKGLKDINATCVGTKIMLSFMKFNGKTCDKFLVV
jgi:hypothetical protein